MSDVFWQGVLVVVSLAIIAGYGASVYLIARDIRRTYREFKKK